MSWPNIVSAVVGGLVGGLAGYIISVVSKPGFRYIGITGNTLGASPPFSSISTQTLQCGARFELPITGGLVRGLLRGIRGVGWGFTMGIGRSTEHQASGPGAIQSVSTLPVRSP